MSERRVALSKDGSQGEPRAFGVWLEGGGVSSCWIGYWRDMEGEGVPTAQRFQGRRSRSHEWQTFRTKRELRAWFWNACTKPSHPAARHEPAPVMGE